MHWIPVLLHSEVWSLASRGGWGPLQEKGAPLLACSVWGSVSAVCACRCWMVCRWCGCVRTLCFSHRSEGTVYWWPCFRSQDPMTPFPQPFPHTDVAHSESGTPSTPAPSVFAHQPWLTCALEPCCLPAGWVWFHAGLGKPANFFSATIPSPTSFELSLGDNHPSLNSLCCAPAALQFALHFYSHTSIIAY